MADFSTTPAADAALRVAGHAYDTAALAIRAVVRDLDDDALDALERRCRALDQTNCWWAEHRAAPAVLEAVAEERHRRHKARRQEVSRG